MPDTMGRNVLRLSDPTMPLYEYVCQTCHSNCELLIRGDDEQPVCPDCGGHSLEKQMSVPSAHARGSSQLPMAPPGGFCGRGTCGMQGCGDN